MGYLRPGLFAEIKATAWTASHPTGSVLCSLGPVDPLTGNPQGRAAEASRPRDFSRNGWVVEALQGTWSAIAGTRSAGSGPAHPRAALEETVRGGRDTDRVPAIAGSLRGAHGFSAAPL